MRTKCYNAPQVKEGTWIKRCKRLAKLNAHFSYKNITNLCDDLSQDELIDLVEKKNSKQRVQSKFKFQGKICALLYFPYLHQARLKFCQGKIQIYISQLPLLYDTALFRILNICIYISVYVSMFQCINVLQKWKKVVFVERMFDPRDDLVNISGPLELLSCLLLMASMSVGESKLQQESSHHQALI